MQRRLCPRLLSEGTLATPQLAAESEALYQTAVPEQVPVILWGHPVLV